jgi:hypothetical protein
MGNIIISDTGDIKQSKIGDLINDWAINEYDAGLSYNKNINKTKQLLKKRACCTRQTEMNIALPTIDLTKDGVNSFSNNYTKIKIKIFKDDIDLSNNCKIDNDDYKLHDNFGHGGYDATIACETLYEGDGFNQGLCNAIKEDRSKQSSDEYTIAYGFPFNKDPNNILNVYKDCNCLNSIYRNNITIDSTTDGRLELNPDNIVQQFDVKCSSVSDSAYKKTDITNERLCINQINTENITATQKGIININQSNSGCDPADTMDVKVNSSFNNTSLPILSQSPQAQSTQSSSSMSSPETQLSSSTLPSQTQSSSSTSPSQKPALNPFIIIAIIVITLLILFIMYKYFVH